MAADLRSLRTVLWLSSLASASGVLLSLWTPYLNVVGVVGSSSDAALRLGPGIAAAGVHLGAAIAAWRSHSWAHTASKACGLFDLTVGLIMLVPWVGFWAALASPFGAVFFLGAIHGPRMVGAATFLAAGVATLGLGLWLLRQARRGQRPDPE